MSYLGLLNQSASFEAQTGKDKNGVASYAAPVSTHVRFEPVSKSVMTATNERVPIDGVVFCAADLSVTVGDRMICQSQKYKVVKRAAVPGANGRTHHIELMVQLWRTTA